MLFSAAHPIPAALTSLQSAAALNGLEMPESRPFFCTSSLSLREQGSRAFFRAFSYMAFVSTEMKRPPAALARCSLPVRGTGRGAVLRVLRALPGWSAGDGGSGGGGGGMLSSGGSSGSATVMTTGSWGSGGRSWATGVP